jgi:murein L,D-transpeptidase YcbB/YkuD
MTRRDFSGLAIVFWMIICLLVSCKSRKRPPVQDIVNVAEQIDGKVTDIIHSSLEFAEDNNGIIDSSIRLTHTSIVKLIYEKRRFTSIWGEKEKWNPLGDSLFDFVQNARLYGLFPDDYHFSLLDIIRRQVASDSFNRRDAVKWANADIMMTDAFVHIVRDLKLGRLPEDSVTLRQDSTLTDESYFNRLALVQKRNSLLQVFQTLEPSNKGYRALKESIPAFLATAEYNSIYTIVPSPKSNAADFKKILQKRLYEAKLLASDTLAVDSVQLAGAIAAFQRSKGLTEDGKIGEETVKAMNMTDRERFIHIAICMDRYKMLPDTMPPRYIWVNLPSFYMQFWENDTLRLLSKIICGKPLTRTPLLTSSISELVTYPQWTIPASIIEKEVLPGIKKDSNYLARKGYSLINDKGDEVSPDSVDWSKYKNGIPYKVVQGSGDANSLGVLKFNFPNKYAVYLHDTNQRYLFAQTKRSLSHGCVRVQDWEKLAYSIVQYDYKDRPGPKPSPVEDSLTTWLQHKEKHSIGVRNRLPLFIRYFTCEGKNGRVVFYDDIYGEDKVLQAKYFTNK